MKKSNNKGISLVTLTIAVMIILIIAGTLIYNSTNGREVKKLKNMYNDIEVLDAKVSEWYKNYGTIPGETLYTNTDKIDEIYEAGQIGQNDNDVYYKIDINSIQNLNLNFGIGYTETDSEDVYIINEQSHKIYYAKGIKSGDVVYYTNQKDVGINLVNETIINLWKKNSDGTRGKYLSGTWTNKDVIIEVTYPQNSEDEDQLIYIGADEENKQYEQYSRLEEEDRTFTETGIAIVKVGQGGTERRKDIYIDKIAPTLKAKNNNTNRETGDVTFTIETSDEGGSKLKELRYKYQDWKNFKTIKINESMLQEGKFTYSNTERTKDESFLMTIEVEDNAGNITRINKVMGGDPIAQITSIGGISISPELVEDYQFYSLKDALEEGDKQGDRYVIQMLKDTTEVNTIQNGKNVTIDLNGHTVRSQDVTITNYGELTILDSVTEGRVETDLYGIVSTEQVAIVCKGDSTLTLGENDNLRPLLVPQIASTTEGKEALFIEKDAQVNFYDGIIKGGAGTTGYELASGADEIVTPKYPSLEAYSAETPNWLILMIHGDAVAKVGTKTYMTVQEAINATEEGHYEDNVEVGNLLDLFQPNGTYYFTKNSDGYLVPNNNGKSNSVANSYLEIDLTTLEGEHELTVTASVSSETNFDIGYAILTDSVTAPSYSQSSGRLIYISGTSGNDVEQTITLQGGQKYYLHIGYRKDGSVNSGNDMFYVKSVTLDGDDKADITITSPIVADKQSTVHLLSYVDTTTGIETVRTISEAVEIDAIRNIKLDLQGNSLNTTSSDNYVIKNYGKLKITDSAETKGAITSSTHDTVYNASSGELTLEDGTINISKVGSSSFSRAIDNNGIYYQTGGTVKTTSQYSIGFYNRGYEEVKITGGSLLTTYAGTSSGDYHTYEIYNAVNSDILLENLQMTTTTGNYKSYFIGNSETGKVTLKNCDINVQTYGIINQTTGTIEIIGGKFAPTGTYTIRNENSGNIKLQSVESIVGTIYFSYGMLDIDKSTINCNIYVTSAKNVTITDSNLNKYCTFSNSKVTIDSSNLTNTDYSTVILVYGEKSQCDISNSNLYSTYGNTNEIITNRASSILNLKENNRIDASKKPSSTRTVTGVYNYDNAILNVDINNTIEGYTYGIWNLNSGIVNISKKDGNNENINQEKPEITGGTYGIYNKSGTVNMYDGILKGKTDSIYGTLSEIETNADMIIGKDGTYNTLKLGANTDSVAQIGNTTYIKLQDAINACPTNGTETEITILKNIDQPNQVQTKEGQNIKLNISGHIVTNYYKNAMIENNGSLTLYDSETTGKLTSKGGPILQNNNGTLTTQNIELALKDACTGIENISSGKVIVKDGTKITNTGSTNTVGIKNYSTGEIEVQGGSIEAYSYNHSIMNVDNSTGTITISGGIIKSTLYNNGGTINITGGTIQYYITNKSGTLKIEEAEGKELLISNFIDNYGTLNMNSGRISYNTYNGYLINNYAGATTKITGGTVENTSTFSGGIYGAIKNLGRLEITGGTISGVGYSYNGNYGSSLEVIYQNSKDAVTILGTKDGNVNTSSPTIISQAKYGLYNNAGTVEFYDGIIKARKTAVYGNITAWEEGYDIITEEQDGYEVEYLGVAPLFQIGNDENDVYTSLETLQQKLNTLEANEENVINIKLLRKLSLLESDITLQIPEGLNVKLDFNGQEVESFNDNLILNNGILEIVDSAVTKGTINVKSGTFIKNKNKNLTIKGISVVFGEGTDGIINEGTGTVELSENCSLTGAANVYVKNNVGGLVKLADSTIYNYTETRVHKGIINEGTGTVEINNGNINVDSSYSNTSCYNISNLGTGIVKINNTILPRSRIQNDSTGRIEILDSTISSSIENKGTMTIDEDEGTTTLSSKVNNYGTFEFNKGTMSFSVTSGYNFYNYNNATFIMKDGIIENTCNSASSTGWYTITYNTYGAISNQGMLELKGGTVRVQGNVSNPIRAIYQNSSTAKTIIGEKGEPYNKTTPHMEAAVNGYGLYNDQGEVEFYDGIIKGKTAPVYGDITKKEENLDLIIEEKDGLQVEYLDRKPLFQIGNDEEDIGYTYGEIQQKINTWKTNNETDTKTIKLLRHLAIRGADSSLEIPEGLNIKIDLNGYIIYSNKEDTIISSSNLEICNSSATSSFVDAQSGTFIKSLKGNLVISNVEMKLSKDKVLIQKLNEGDVELKENAKLTLSSSAIGIKNESLGKILINTSNINISASAVAIQNTAGGSVKYNDGAVSTGNGGTLIENTSAGNVYVTGGIIGEDNKETIRTAIKNTGSGTVEVTGGIIKLDGHASGAIGSGFTSRIIFNQSGNIKIKGGYLEKQGNGGENIYSEGGTIDITGGTLISKYINSIYDNGGTINIDETDGNIVFEGNIQGGTINMISGTITSNITQSHNGVVNMTGGTVNGCVKVRNANIVNGTISNSNSDISNGSAIVPYGSTAVINIGTRDGEYDNTSPIISGSTYGVYNLDGATVNFYDGTISGGTNAIYGTVSDLEYNFKLLTKTVDSVEQATLTILGEVERVVGIGSVNYPDLETAVDICPTNGTAKTITLYKRIELEELIAISDRRNITISLNGFAITYNGTEITEANKNTAFIIDENSSLTITN